MDILTLATLLIISLHKASPLELPKAEVPDDLDDLGEIEAVLQSVHECPESSRLVYRWMNPVLDRMSPDTVAVTVAINVTEEIPEDPTLLAEILIENQPGDNDNDRTPVFKFDWLDICGDLKAESNDGVKAFKHSIEGGIECPIKPGQYIMKKLVMNLNDVKPFLRDGKMIFTVTQKLEGEVISCNVIEYLVSWG